MSRPKILLVAQHANPEWGSEPLIGWRWFEALSAHREVILVTHVRNRPALERRAAVEPWFDPNSVRYVDTERVAARIARWNDRLWGAAAPVNRLILEAVAQLAFDRGATRAARAEVAAGGVEVIHRVSPISPRFPTRLVDLGVPVVIGPVNGGMRTLEGFDEVARAERERALALRPFARLLDPTHRTWRRAAAVLAASETALASLPAPARRRARVVSENAVELGQFEASPERRGVPLQALYLGRLLRYKGVEHLIRAVARLRERAWVLLDVVGDGPDRPRLEGLTRELGVEDRVTFHGACAVSEVPAWMKKCDVYAFPSVRESGGATLLEAMACAKPVIAVAHGGPAETVVPEVGYPLTPRSPSELTALVTEALAELHDDEARRCAMGLAARRRVEERYTWSGKARLALKVYEEVRRGTADQGSGRTAFRPGTPDPSQGASRALARTVHG